MSDITAPGYLRSQYAAPDNLRARCDLHALYSVNPYGWFRWVFDQFDLREGSRVLEVGCGEGALWARNADRLPAGLRLWLSDLSPGMAGAAANSLRHEDALAGAMVADAMALPCADGSMDAIVANHMLYHVPVRSRALDGFVRLLRRGGALYATTVGRGHMIELTELVAAVAPGLDPWGGRSPRSFMLEDAPEELRRWFGEVEVRRYEDALRITDVQPLVEYVLSLVPGGLSAAGVDALRDAIARRIADAGAVHITKAQGMLIARG